MPQTPTIQQLAAEAAACFETAERTDGTSFVRIKDGSPDWVTDLTHQAHGDMLPDDWRYQCIRQALDAIEEKLDPEDCAHEFADSEVDVYSTNRTAWLASHPDRADYCDTAADDLGKPDGGILDRIALGQYAEAHEVYNLVLDFLRNATEALS